MVWCYKKQQEEFLMWVEEFNKLRKNIFINKRKLENIVAFMDLHIFKGDNFFMEGKLTIKVYQNQKIDTCIFRMKAHTQSKQLKIM